jgi:hypothetical protein
LFPEEITKWPQWVCWRSTLTSDSKQTKLPYCPVTGKLASVADPSTWTDYSTAVSVAKSNPFYSGIGFVLTENDPYCFIDLDDPQGDTMISERHVKIAEAMNSYSEVSPSGKGLHIIVKAKVAGGRRRSKVEVYSSNRYMTMSGQVYHNKPISERQYLVDLLWQELNDNGGGNSQPVVESQQIMSDDSIYHMAIAAENGQKFENLWNGNWEQHYGSQSEADFALINIIGFYSRNSEQIARIFRLSALGKRDKAQRKSYVDSMIKRSFDNMPPPISIDALSQKVANDMAKKDAEKDQQSLNVFAGPLFANIPDEQYDWTKPPGLLGEIAEFIYAAAPRPVKEIALGAAIGLMAGICGRAYNVSGTGLNQYVMLLAKTGVGKEGAVRGIDRLMQYVRRTVPAAMDFVGPAGIASGQALIKYLSKHSCFVSVVGEFGLKLQQMCSPSANMAQVTLRATLLELYNKSGESDSLRPTIYADSDKNTQTLRSPSFSLLGESTPDIFYQSLDEAMIAQGLMPRFTCVEYDGNRPSLNQGFQTAEPAKQLVDGLSALCANCLILAQHQRVVSVVLDVEAEKVSQQFNVQCDARINTSDLEVARQLWNRAHIKTLKLAALIAIGQNPFQPTITAECITWAKILVERDVTNVLKQFESGRAGRDTGELNQINETVQVIAQYMKRPFAGLEKYQVLPQMHMDKVFSLAYLQRKLLQRGPFKNDRMGATNALKRCLDSLSGEGCIRELRQMDVWNRYGKTIKCYIVVDASRFA